MSPSADGETSVPLDRLPPLLMLLEVGRHQPPPTREGGETIIKVFLRRFFLKKSGRGVKGARSPLAVTCKMDDTDEKQLIPLRKMVWFPAMYI